MKAVIDYSRLSLMVLTCVIFYNEFLVYFNSYRGWPQPASKKNLLKVLLVADPQIQGAHDMDNWLLGSIFMCFYIPEIPERSEAGRRRQKLPCFSTIFDVFPLFSFLDRDSEKETFHKNRWFFTFH